MKREELIFDQKFEGALTISKLSKIYGVENPFIALNDVSVQFFTGEFVVVLRNRYGCHFGGDPIGKA